MSPAGSLTALASQLRAEDTVISPHVADSGADPALGRLAASGPRAAAAPAEYALLVEAVREGYLLHYGEPRILAGHDPDLALLAGDYLYAIGLERLAGLGDAEAVRELSDLISLCAQCHAEDRTDLVSPLWLAAAVAVGCGPTDGHAAAKDLARRLDPEAPAMLLREARLRAESAGILGALDETAASIDFPAARQA
jgi:hypothetical protein